MRGKLLLQTVFAATGLAFHISVYTQVSETADSIAKIKAKSYILKHDTVSQNKQIVTLKELVNEKFLGKPEPLNYLPLNDMELLNFYQQFQGQTIKEIRIKQLDVFGQSVSDTLIVPHTWFMKMGNGLHVSTQKRIINNQLLLKPNTLLDPLDVCDNERIIREMPSIEDVRIYANNVDEGNDSVNLLVVTKDVLPVGFSIDLYDVKYGRLGVWNKNLLGFGHEFYYWLTWDYNRFPYYGHKFRYRIQNIANTFVTGDAWYENSWNIESYKFYLNRDFFTPNTKFAGGAGFEKILNTRDIELPDTILLQQYISSNYYDFWLGRAFILKNKTNLPVRKSIAITGRISKYHFFHAPEVAKNYLYDYYNRTIFLTSIGFSQQGFIRSKRIYGFGKSEDVSYGSLLSITLGMDINNYRNRPYAAFSFSNAIPLKGTSLLYQNLSVGSFFNPNIEQGLFKYYLRYYSPSINKDGRYPLRIFTTLDYRYGHRRFSDEFMSLNNSDAIRGLQAKSLRGDQRLSFNFETVCYSPNELLGFRFNYFVFVDAGMITNESKNIFKNPVYSGIGIGVRLRNDHLAFNTLQLRLVYFPNIPYDGEVEYFEASGLGEHRPDKFSLSKPELLIYQNR